MRKIVLIPVIVVAAFVLIAAALAGYAYFNLSSIIAHNQDRILTRVSEALGRRVEVGKLQAQIGWGVSAEVSDLTIADDPAFSAKPFLSAGEVKVDVEFIPLLGGEAKVKSLELSKPHIRLVMNAGQLNLSTIGSKAGKSESASSESGGRRSRRSSLADLSIKTLSIADGEIYFNDLSEKAAPVRVHHLDFDVTNFDAASAFDVDTKFAFPGDVQNVEASGKVGPLLKWGILEASATPVAMTLKLDSILLDSLRPLADIGSEIPPGLSIPDAASITGTVSGTFGQLAIALNTDLTANRVAYTTVISKPAGTPMTVNANIAIAGQVQIPSATMKLSDLQLTATNFSGVTGPQPFAAQLDSNAFNLANLSPMITAVARYDMTGTGEVHGTVTLGNAPAVDGTVTLKQAALKLGPSMTGGVSDLNGIIQFKNGGAVVQPTSFALSGGPASVEGRVESFSPLRASYALKAGSVRLAQFFASQPPGDVVNGLEVKGTADGEISAPRLSATIRSTDGSLENVSFNNLDLTAAYFERRVSARPLNVALFGGSITADADAVFGEVPNFDATLVMRNLDIETGLLSQNLEAAHTLRGLLSGNVAVTGRGADWDRIRPTLRGSGRVAIANGKLKGVNIVADAINAVAAAPGVSSLVNVAFMSSHHGLLVDPDTELQAASMTFQQEGPRFTTHDLFARSPDYAITSDGWFDMDKNIDMRSDIQLTLGLQVAIPVTVSRKLPEVRVLPDVPTLAERVAMGAINTPGNIIRGGVNAVGSVVGAPSAGTAIPSIPNPIDALKKLLP